MPARRASRKQKKAPGAPPKRGAGVWRDPSQYPDPSATTLHRWAWEFLQRNPKFQAEFEAALPSQQALIAADKLPLCWNEQPIGMVLWYWGVRQPRGLWAEFADDPFGFDVAPRHPPHGQIYGQGQWIVAAPERSDRMLLEFDLTTPIDPQIERARRILTANQDIRFTKKKRRRNQADKFPTYLRVLDALAAGATTREILEVFSNERDAIDEKMLARWKKRAVDLRDAGYRELLTL